MTANAALRTLLAEIDQYRAWKITRQALISAINRFGQSRHAAGYIDGHFDGATMVAEENSTKGCTDACTDPSCCSDKILLVPKLRDSSEER